MISVLTEAFCSDPRDVSSAPATAVAAAEPDGILAEEAEPALTPAWAATDGGPAERAHFAVAAQVDYPAEPWTDGHFVLAVQGDWVRVGLFPAVELATVDYPASVDSRAERSARGGRCALVAPDDGSVALMVDGRYVPAA